MTNLSMFREAVLAVNARLKEGEPAHQLPCPKCGNERYIALEVIGKEPTKTAACGCCGFSWVVL